MPPSLLVRCATVAFTTMALPKIALAADVSRPPVREFDVREHSVTANPWGRLQEPSLSGKKVSFKLVEGEKEEAQYYAHLVDRIIAEAPTREGKKQILIFIHGGLNDPKEAVLRAAELSKNRNLQSLYYPVFLNWDSHFVSTYFEHLLWIRQGENKGWAGAITSPFYLVEDIGRGIFRAPAVWTQLIQSNLQQPGPVYANSSERRRFESAHLLLTKEDNRGIHVTAQTEKELDKRTHGETFTNAVKAVATIPVQAAGSIVLDTLGTPSWDVMLRRSRLLFDSPVEKTDLTPDESAILYSKSPDDFLKAFFNASEKQQRDIRSYVNRSRPGAVSGFLTQLQKRIMANPRNYSITLIGHSMGAIVVNEILPRYSHLPFDNIVYMAAACSTNDCERAVVPYLRDANTDAQFFSLSLHPYAEAAESNFYDLAPRGSLLQWLDAFFTNPNSIEDRRYGKWRTAVVETGIFPATIRSRVHLKVFAVGESVATSEPQKHGDFAIVAEKTTKEAAVKPKGLNFWDRAYWEPQK